MKDLKNKVAVITGGNSGIGFATAQELLAHEARVLITGRNPAAVKEAVAALGGGAEGFVADQGSLADAAKLADYVKEHYGKADVLFVNAGVGRFSPVADTSEADFDEIMNINFKGAFFTTQYLLPVLNEGGNIIFLSSINAVSGMPGASVYSASKAAMNSLARTLARELAGRNIRVNIVNPGPIITPILDKTGHPAEELDALRSRMRSSVPLGRMGEAAEVAKLVRFLASADASFVTGAEINVDGGLMVHPILS